MKDYGRLLGTERRRAHSPSGSTTSRSGSRHVRRLPDVQPLDVRVAVQDPCHLRHVQRVHEATRTVLRPFVREVVELDDEGSVLRRRRRVLPAGAGPGRGHPGAQGRVDRPGEARRGRERQPGMRDAPRRRTTCGPRIPWSSCGRRCHALRGPSGVGAHELEHCCRVRTIGVQGRLRWIQASRRHQAELDPIAPNGGQRSGVRNEVPWLPVRPAQLERHRTVELAPGARERIGERAPRKTRDVAEPFCGRGDPVECLRHIARVDPRLRQAGRGQRASRQLTGDPDDALVWIGARGAVPSARRRRAAERVAEPQIPDVLVLAPPSGRRHRRRHGPVRGRTRPRLRRIVR